MNYRNLVSAAAYLLVAMSGTLSAIASSRVESFVQVTRDPVKFGRTDFNIILNADFTDPYKAEEVKLDLVLTAPSGRELTLPCFYERGKSGESSEWQARFAAAECGDYAGTFVLTDKTGAYESAPVNFTVKDSDSKGFLRTDGLWTLKFDNGERFRGIGENLCWEARGSDDSAHFKDLNENRRFNFEYMFGKLAAHGGNFTRVWMCAWNMPLEWKTLTPTATTYLHNDPNHFNRSGIVATDNMVELLDRTGLYLMLCMGQHGEFREGLWALNNYNKANGGPLEEPLDFFSNAEAKQMYKNRLRYIVARWGYSTHVAAWEFFNEVDIVLPEIKHFLLPKAAITAWHKEMSAYLKSIDPYNHIRTTSVTFKDIPGLNDVPDLDLNQRHIYCNTKAIPTQIRKHLVHNKPYSIGEFGYDWDWSKDFNTFADKMDYDFKEGLWTGLFSPTPILPMTWWWEFFDNRELTAYYSRVRAMSDRMLAAGNGELAEAKAKWDGRGIEAYAVKAGKCTFALLVNRSEKPRTGTLILVDAAKAKSFSLYDTETDKETPLASLENLTVPARNSVIVIAE
jgi:hypothetical protein